MKGKQNPKLQIALGKFVICMLRPVWFRPLVGSKDNEVRRYFGIGLAGMYTGLWRGVDSNALEASKASVKRPIAI